MATNIGPKISVEGEAEYRKQMAQIIAQQKALAAEMKATVSGFASTASAQEKARASASVLDRQIANLSDALKAQQGQLDKAAAKYGENSKEALAYRTAVYNTTAELNKLKNQLGGTADAVEDTGDAMAAAGKQGIKLGDIIKANVISDFIVSGLREVAAAAKEMAASFVQAAADVRAETAQYEQTFGDLAGGADAAIQQVADSANTLPSLLKPAATSIYAFARSSGADTAQAMDLMAQSMQVAVDAAAYYDRSLSETTETLQSFLKGNYENDAALGVSATETTRNAQAMEMFGKEFNDLTEIQKQQALLQMVVDAQELSGAMGQAAREADGWANVQGNLNEAWRQFSASKGQALLDALIPAVQEVTSLLIGLTDGSLSAGQALEQAFGFVQQQAVQLAAQLPQALSSLGSLGAYISDSLAAALPQVQATALSLLGSLRAGIEANLPQLMDTGLQALASFSAGLRESAGQLVDQGLDLILSLAQGIADGLPALIENVPQIVSNIASIINDNAPKILAAGVQLIVTLGKGLIEAIPTLVANIPEILNAIVNVFLAFNWLNIGKQVVTAIGNGIKGAGSFLSSSSKSIVDTLYNGVKSLPATMRQIGRDLVQGLIDGIKGMISGVKDNIAEVAYGAVSTLKDILGIHSPSTVFKELGVNMVEGLVNGLVTSTKGAQAAARELAEGQIDAYVKASKDALEAAQKELDDAVTDSAKKTAQAAVDAAQQAYDDAQKQAEADKALAENMETIAAELGEGTGISYATAIIDAVKSQDWGSLASTVLQAGFSLLSSGDKQMLTSWVAQALHTINAGFTSGGFGGMATAAGGVLKNLVGAVTSGSGGFGALISTLGANFSGLASAATGALGSIGTALTGLASAAGPVGIAIAAVVALGGAFAVATAEGDTLGEKISNVFKGIGETISNVVSAAFSWGRDLIEGIGDGIASAANWLFSGVKSIAQGIASFLHFSHPDRGPLREYEQWMPDMMAGMAKGIRLNSSLLEGAAQDAATKMRSALTVPADLAAAAVGTAPAQSAGRSLAITIGDIIVNGSSVQDVDDLADLIVQKITRQVRRKEAAYGLV